jgi:hypothetical protein
MGTVQQNTWVVPGVQAYQEYTLKSLVTDPNEFPLAPGATGGGHHTITFVGTPGVVGTHGPLSDGIASYTMADAVSSTLTGTYSGSFVRVPVPTLDGSVPTQALVVLNLDLKYTQGTGKLQGVTGTAHMVGIAVGLSSENFTYTTVGTLNGRTSQLP